MNAEQITPFQGRCYVCGEITQMTFRDVQINKYFGDCCKASMAFATTAMLLAVKKYGYRHPEVSA